MKRNLLAAFLVGVFVGHYTPHIHLHGYWEALSFLPIAILIVYWAFLYARIKRPR